MNPYVMVCLLWARANIEGWDGAEHGHAPLVEVIGDERTPVCRLWMYSPQTRRDQHVATLQCGNRRCRLVAPARAP